MHRAFFGDTEEHRRDEVFAGEREDSGNFVDCAGFENRESGFDEAYDEVRGTRGMQRARERLESADFCDRNYAPHVRRLDRARNRCVLLQSQVRPAPMIVVRETLQVMVQAPFAEHDYVIQALAADGAGTDHHIPPQQ